MGSIQTITGDCLIELPKLAAGSVQCIVTSPPYFRQRNYGIEKSEWPVIIYAPLPGIPSLTIDAWQGVLGDEPTPEAFIGHLVYVFRLAKTVLDPRGTVWLNLGDCYWNSTFIREKSSDGFARKGDGEAYDSYYAKNGGGVAGGKRRSIKHPGLKEKDLVGIPWRAAFALQADGWYLRSDIIWAKPNGMPESVTDRPTKAHEYIFLLSRQEKYYYNAAAIKQPIAVTTADRMLRGVGENHKNVNGAPGQSPHSLNKPRLHAAKGGAIRDIPPDRNKRSVWQITPQHYKDAHYATFPPELIEPCVLAGTREGDTVLDMFGGSGTTGQVAIKHSRKAILIEIKPDHVRMIKKRTAKVQKQLALE